MIGIYIYKRVSGNLDTGKRMLEIKKLYYEWKI